MVMLGIMAAAVHPVVREQAFLESYFQCLSNFAYDKAREISEKERDSSKQQSCSTWGTIVNCLVSLATAEKAYASLQFLAQNPTFKLIGRRETLKTSSYDYLLKELKKIGENSQLSFVHPNVTGDVSSFMYVVRDGDGSQPRSGADTPVDNDPYIEQLLGHLCGQLSHFIIARIKVMEFFEQVVNAHGAMHQAPYRPMGYEDLLEMVSEIAQAHQKDFHHPILSPLRTSFMLECDILRHLLEAQIQLQTWHFLPCLIHLHDAHSKLGSWGPGSLAKESKKLGFGSSKSLAVPALYQWLLKYKAHLVAKFSLYFYDVLSKQCPPGEMKSILTKTSVDFYSKIVTFQRKSDALSVLIVLDVNGVEETYRGVGYHHPDKETTQPTGLDSYPAIFCSPGERPDKHWPAVVSIMNDRLPDSTGGDKIVYFYDEKVQSTYYMSSVETRMTFVIIFESKKSEKDNYINNFIHDICNHLRCSKIFTSLKPGSK